MLTPNITAIIAVLLNGDDHPEPPIDLLFWVSNAGSYLVTNTGTFIVFNKG